LKKVRAPMMKRFTILKPPAPPS